MGWFNFCGKEEEKEKEKRKKKKEIRDKFKAKLRNSRNSFVDVCMQIVTYYQPYLELSLNYVGYMNFHLIDIGEDTIKENSYKFLYDSGLFECVLNDVITLQELDELCELNKELAIERIKLEIANKRILESVLCFGILGKVKNLKLEDGIMSFTLYDDTGEIMVMKCFDGSLEDYVLKLNLKEGSTVRVSGSLDKIHNLLMLKYYEVFLEPKELPKSIKIFLEELKIEEN